MTRGSVEDTTAYATTNSTGYAESVLGAGIGSNGKVLSLTSSSSCLPNLLFQSALSELSELLAVSPSSISIVSIVTPMTIEGGDGELVQPPRRR